MLLAVAVLACALRVAAVPASSGGASTARETAVHVLNRLGFGPRPGDVERVLATGIAAYIDRQLRPEEIADPVVAASLKRFPTLGMTTAELVDKFERPLREAQRERRRELASKASAMSSGTAKDSVATDEAEKIRQRIPFEMRPRRVIEELTQARILRACESERQLNEVLVDFWMNHFNVFAAKELDRVFITSFERDVVRPRIWGRFEDLLLATAKSPAMLFYLDNAPVRGGRSPSPGPARSPLARPLRPGRLRNAQTAANAESSPGGLNENYARELMELHTLGVDGGYNQKDVTELARVLTGWSIVRPEEGAGFLFRAALHDAGSKTVLGHAFPAGGGIEEGETMIQILARHPATARHIAFQLCQRFVADEPPGDLVDRVAKKFLETDGDLRETVRAVVTSPEFFDPRYHRAKVKSPFEYVVSAVRALGAVPRRPAPHRAAARADGRAALPVPAADRIFGYCRRLGQHGRAGDAPELRPPARRQTVCRAPGRTSRGSSRRRAPRMRRRPRTPSPALSWTGSSPPRRDALWNRESGKGIHGGRFRSLPD